jgi:asparagine synthase (glutamine-hydrolysing)
VYTDDIVSLGHLRLSIIDTSEQGSQPLWNHARTKVIVYNGELYNYQELREELEKEGAVFNTKTDTEVVLAAIDVWGLSAVNRFHGMWAFCIYSVAEKKFYLSRDRFGIKPLYYRSHGKQFIFSSEIKGIAVHDFKKEIDREALDEFLCFRYNYTDKTLLAGVYQLLPGCSAVVDLRTGAVDITQYWELPSNPTHSAPDHTHVRALVETAVRRRFVGDVKLGTYLSGGVDSSVVSVVTKRFQKEKFFSIVATTPPKQKEFSEEPFARLVAEKYAIDLLCVPITRAEYWKHYLEAIYHNDYPLMFPANVPQFLLAKVARKHNSPIMLSGEGGDEVFAGYERHRTHSDALFFKVVRALHAALPIAAQSILGYGYKAISIYCFRDKFRVENLLLPERVSHALNIGFLQRYARTAIYSPRMRKHAKHAAHYLPHSLPKQDSLNRKLALEMQTYLRMLLHKQDRMNMAFAIEARVPLLDVDLVQYAFSLPGKQKYGRSGKAILKKAFLKQLPSEIVNRKKEGFLLPYESYYADGLEEWFFAHALILKQGYFNETALQKLFSGKNIYYLQIFFSLEIWYRYTVLGHSQEQVAHDVGGVLNVHN